MPNCDSQSVIVRKCEKNEYTLLNGCHHPDLNASNITNGKQSRKQKVAVWNAAKKSTLRGIVIVTCLFNLKEINTHLL